MQEPVTGMSIPISNICADTLMKHMRGGSPLQGKKTDRREKERKGDKELEAKLCQTQNALSIWPPFKLSSFFCKLVKVADTFKLFFKWR